MSPAKTVSQEGLSCKDGGRRSSAKTDILNLRQSHNCISIDLIFGEGDHVREFTSPAKFGSDLMSGRGAKWGQHIRVLTFFVDFYSSTELQPIRVNQYLAHNSSKEAVWCEEDPFWDEKCLILKFGGVLPLKNPKIVRNGQLSAKSKMSNNL